MKLPIKKKYFDEIKSGYKIHEYRDAHITFVCEETGEMLSKNIVSAKVLKRHPGLFPDVLKDDLVLLFELEKHQIVEDRKKKVIEIIRGL